MLKLLLALVAGAAFGTCLAAYPEQPVKLVVAFAPGSSTDILARLLAGQMTAAMGHTVVLENKPGAGGSIATQQVMGAPADGYTLLIHSVAVAVNPSLFVNAGYDPLRDLAPVAMAAVTPNPIYVHPDVKANTLAKLLALTRMGKLSVASSGNGTTTHLGAEWLFRALAKADITHVPFQPAVATNAVVSGQVLVASMSMPPADVVDRLNAEVNKALTAKPVTERFETLSLEAQHLDRPATRSCLAAEVAKWEKLLKDIGVKVE